MSKAKRAYKKELKKKMNLKLKDRVKRKLKKFKLLFIIFTTLASVIVAIKAVIAVFEKKRAKDPARTGLKDILAFFITKSVTMAEDVNSGIMIGGYVSKLNVDLSQCEFKDHSFIAVKSVLSAIYIAIPENVNVKFDSINSFTYIKQEYDTDSFTEGNPTVYIALKGAFSSVIISKAETVDEETEQATANE